MHGHRLGGELDSANRRKPAIPAQWVVECAVLAGDAADRDVIPAQDAVEEAHGTGMRNERRDSVFVDQHRVATVSAGAESAGRASRAAGASETRSPRPLR